ncbi:hypothetical protein Q757_00425 [Oenococcus alcoholitolerans]|uniref:HTH lacI-type domain-containing protein n=1 Tax=Oenococcus alcoholitolerans TaxID=931074 RepID=A0ABR4XST8_9LACO|nr:hypothetical protein Q757_00425 [Oenococcus alcoholitolerans]
MAGIREIAKRAKVSISTVSYALNGSDKVSKKTRDRVIKIADDLNYTPNLAGQTLKNKKLISSAFMYLILAVTFIVISLMAFLKS